jgi:hypothetical protein
VRGRLPRPPVMDSSQQSFSLSLCLSLATQPGLVSPGSGDQAQRYHQVNLSSESGENSSTCRLLLRHVCNRSVVMRMRGRHPRPPVSRMDSSYQSSLSLGTKWTFKLKSGSVCFFCSIYYKAVRVGGTVEHCATSVCLLLQYLL